MRTAVVKVLFIGPDVKLFQINSHCFSVPQLDLLLFIIAASKGSFGIPSRARSASSAGHRSVGVREKLVGGLAQDVNLYEVLSLDPVSVTDGGSYYGFR